VYVQNSGETHLEMLQAVGAAIILRNNDGIVTFWNRGAEDLYGWTAEEALGRPTRELLLTEPHGSDIELDAAIATIIATIEAGESWTGEWTVRTKSGAKIDVRVTHAPLRNSAGAIIGILGFAIPIADEVAARLAVEVSDRRFRALVTNSSDGIAVLDDTGRLTYASPSLCRMLGAEEDDVIGRPAAEFIEIDDAMRMTSLFGGRRTGDAGPIELRLVAADGSVVEIEGHRSARLDDPAVNGIVWNLRDVSATRAAQKAIARSEERLQALAAGSSDVTLVLAADGTILYVGGSAERVFGRQVADLLGTTAEDLIYPADLALVSSISALTEFAAASEAPVRFRLQHGDGRWRWVEGRFADQLQNPAVEGIVANIRDVTEQHLAEIALRDSEVRYRSIVETAEEGIWIHDLEGTTTFANPKMATTLLTTTEALCERSLFDFVPAADLPFAKAKLGASGCAETEQYEFRLRRADGSPIDVLFSTSPVRDPLGRVVGGLKMVTDISQRKQAEAESARLALTDPLTGLANRALVVDRIRQLLARQHREERTAALLFIDLDNFKQINDSLGHSHGDRLLRDIAERISGVVGPHDTVGRFGGDEFIVLLDDIDTEASALRMAESIARAVRTPLRTRQNEVVVTASIGISLTPATDASALLRDADSAMYRAKELGGNRYEVFDAALRARAVTHHELETDLRQAIENGELSVHYQPVVSLDARIVALEALARWTHPTRGSVSPGDFIPIAESTGLIVEMGAWILDQACRDIARWRQIPGREQFTVAVNLSGRQLAEADLPRLIATTLSRYGLASDALTLEITESVLMSDTAAATASLTAIHDLGVRLAVDDFGTGYSSLLYLRRFPVDALKLDRFFVAGIDRNPQDRAIVRAVIDLAHSLDLYAVAEGVETTGQLQALQTMGCDLAQGYLWSPAVPAHELDELLRQDVMPQASAAEADLSPASVPALTDRAAGKRRRISVLLVDDSDAERSLLRAHLERTGGFEVVGDATNGEAAVILAGRTKPHLVLLDMAMPGIDGLETLPRLLRASPSSQVAILSGYVSPGLRSQAMSAGAFAVFEKGYAYDAVIEQLHALTDGPILTSPR
jgi:diguanylate cyclase (GGDEF)-like protein/PAS domain S-box-containing protein